LNPSVRCVQKLLLQVMQHKRLLESHDDVMLLQKIQLRAPYVTPLNVLQVTHSTTYIYNPNNTKFSGHSIMQKLSWCVPQCACFATLALLSTLYRSPACR